jgi:hypothetical protein
MNDGCAGIVQSMPELVKDRISRLSRAHHLDKQVRATQELDGPVASHRRLAEAPVSGEREKARCF